MKQEVLLYRLLLGPEHRMVRGPIEIVPIIIRARAPKVRGPIEIGPFLIIIQAVWRPFWGL